jgi:hypothetical protein
LSSENQCGSGWGSGFLFDADADRDADLGYQKDAIHADLDPDPQQHH